MEPYALQLSRYAADLRYEAIPAPVAERMKLLVLDTLGVGVFGAQLPWCKTVYDYAAYLAGPAESTLWGLGKGKVAAPNAALANGTSCHCFELDETHRKSWLHAVGVTLPAAMAIGETNGLTGKELIATLVAAVDVNIRVALSIDIERLNRRGLHPTGALGHFGGAIAAAKALRLDAPGIASAFGLAGSRAMGTEIIKVDGSHLKRLYSGRAAHNGVESALLAQRGLDGPVHIIEGEYGGIFDVLWGVTETPGYDLTRLTTGLGSDFSELLQIMIKCYPLHSHVHPAVDVALDLANENDLDWRDIEKVTLRTRTRNATRLAHTAPATVMLAQQSFPYTVAASFVDRTFGVDQVANERLSDPRLIDFATHRVRLIADPEMDRIFPEDDPADMEVRMKSGKVFHKRTENGRGTPKQPLSTEQVTAKFRGLASRVLPDDKVQGLQERVLRLEECDDVREISALLS